MKKLVGILFLIAGSACDARNLSDILKAISSNHTRTAEDLQIITGLLADLEEEGTRLAGIQHAAITKMLENKRRNTDGASTSGSSA